MKLSLKLLIGVLLVGAGIGLYLYLTRRRASTSAVASATPNPQAWALSDHLQGTQIAALANVVGNTISRTEVMSLLAQQPAVSVVTPPATSTPSAASGPDLRVTITQNGQTSFVVSAGEPRRKLFLNGEKLSASTFVLAPPSLTYSGPVPLETDDELLLAY